MARTSRILLLAIALLALSAPLARADTYTVTTTSDGADDGECVVDCTLREAIGRADVTAATDDLITLPAGKIVLSAGELTPSTTMTIVGAGTRSTIVDAAGASRVFNLDSDNAATRTTFRDLTITGGNAGAAADGGGIFAITSVTLERVAVTGNTAGMAGGGIGIPPHGSVAATDRTLTVSGSTIAGNRVAGGAGNGLGGGVMAFANVSMVNTTIVDNEVANPGTTQGGGMVQSLAPAKLTNVTIAGNRITTAGGTGGGLAGNNLTSVSGVTVTQANTMLEARNVIIAGNTVGGTPEDCELVTASLSLNNVSSAEGCGFADAGSRQNTDPQLLALGDYGGPTDTRRLNATSPVIDLGTADGCPIVDQRGVARPLGTACDPGATEAASPVATGLTPSNVTASAASLNGTVTNPSPTLNATAFIEYGPTLAYGSRAATITLGPGAAVPIGARVEGLAPGTEYHFRITVANDERTVGGPDGTTKTAAAPTPKPPVAVAGAKPKISTKGSTSTRRCLRTSYTLKLRTTIARGAKVKSVRVTLDGKRRGGVKNRTSQTLKISVRRLKKGRHTLKITVIDSANKTTTITRKFTRCGARKRR